MKHSIKHNNNESNLLIKEALDGSSVALEKLISYHYNFIYNVAIKFILIPDDALDITQEVIIKIITNLSKFNHQSDFKTWVYRIVFNHFLNIKKRETEKKIISFEDFGNSIDHTENNELNIAEQIEQQELIIDTKFGCMTAMLMCLNRDYRLIYILGEIFNIESKVAADTLEITPENFRKKLSRARKLLHNFMNEKCSVANNKNECKCSTKTKGFIKAGWVTPNDLEYNNNFDNNIKEVVDQKIIALDTLTNSRYDTLYKDHPYYNKDRSKDILNKLINDNELKAIINSKDKH